MLRMSDGREMMMMMMMMMMITMTMTPMDVVPVRSSMTSW